MKVQEASTQLNRLLSLKFLFDCLVGERLLTFFSDQMRSGEQPVYEILSCFLFSDHIPELFDLPLQ